VYSTTDAGIVKETTLGREKRSLFIIAWEVINGVNENEAKGKNSEREPCFTVIVLSFARETKDK